MTEDKDKPSKELQEAMREILSICEKRKIGAHVILASQTHAKYELYFPEWSNAQIENSPEGEGIRFKAESIDEEKTIAGTIHFFKVMNKVSSNLFTNTNDFLKGLENEIHIEGDLKRV